MRFRQLTCAQDIVELVKAIGFLPFFECGIPGFSVEACCAPGLWFSEDQDGPWEWKGPVARSGACIYGKVFGGRAGFVSAGWLPDFANLRRDGYDFDARYDDGLASAKDKGVYEALCGRGAMNTKELKAACHYRKGQNKGFETVITRLQMQTYVCVADFVYLRDQHGEPYGWGVAQYSTPEALFGTDYVTSAYDRPPQASRERILSHLANVLEDVPAERIDRLIG